MGGLSQQRRLAADILKVGENKVWMDPAHLEDVKNAITRADVRKMISHGYIKAKKEKLKGPRLAKKRKKGTGSRKGAVGARLSKKERWMKTIRPLRRRLKELRDEGKIEERNYRKLYRLVKAGAFRSRAHLELHLKQRGLLREDES